MFKIDRAMRLIAKGELDSSMLEDAINVRFCSCMHILSLKLDIPYKKIVSISKKILSNAEIKQS